MHNDSSIYDIQKENDFYILKMRKKSKINAIISLILSIVPLLLILYCYISSGGSGDESGEGAIWWLVVIYYYTIGLPVAIISLICGIISFKSYKNVLALISIIITLVPFIYILIAILSTAINNDYVIITTS